MVDEITLLPRWGSNASEVFSMYLRLNCYRAFHCNRTHDLRNQVFVLRLVCFYSHIKSAEYMNL